MSVTVISPDTATMVAHEELAPSPSERADQDGFVATRRLKCAWADRLALMVQLLGYAPINQVDGNGAGTLVVYLPHAYPHGFSAAVAKAVAIEPEGKSAASAASNRVISWPTPSYAILTVEYRTPKPGDPQQQQGDPSTVTITDSLDPTVEYVTASNMKLAWSVGGSPIEQAEVPSFPVRMYEVIRRISNVTSVPASWCENAGKCNLAAFTLTSPISLACAAETLLYHGATPVRTWSPNGDQKIEVQMRMSYKSTGWNKFWRSGYSTPQTIYQADGSQFKPVTPISFGFLG